MPDNLGRLSIFIRARLSINRQEEEEDNDDDAHLLFG
jgi:hypothetical protein